MTVWKTTRVDRAEQSQPRYHHLLAAEAEAEAVEEAVEEAVVEVVGHKRPDVTVSTSWSTFSTCSNSMRSNPL